MTYAPFSPNYLRLNFVVLLNIKRNIDFVYMRVQKAESSLFFTRATKCKYGFVYMGVKKVDTGLVLTSVKNVNMILYTWESKR